MLFQVGLPGPSIVTQPHSSKRAKDHRISRDNEVPLRFRKSETKGIRSLDLTQRVERRLARIHASQNVFKRWLFEGVCCLVSATCMGAIVALYIYIREKPLREAGNLLSFANVLGKVASAALIVPTSEALGQLKWDWFHKSNAIWDFEIFDKASRGPWGAMMLLFRTRGRSLAALGAIIIVLLLAIDTFFQQVVILPTRWMLVAQAGMIPRTVLYEPSTVKVYMDGVRMVSDDKDIFHVLEQYAYGNGTQPIPFGNGTRSDIPVSCPTSRCTWPVYDTLGVCSQCADISDYLEFGCLNARIDWTSQRKGGMDVEQWYPNGTMCGYFLNATSHSPILMSGYVSDKSTDTDGEALIMRTLPLTDMLRKTPLFGKGSIHFAHLRNTIADTLIVSAPDGTAASVKLNATPVAHECVFNWCVKRISSRYEHGEYDEIILDNFVNTTDGLWPWSATPFTSEDGNGTDVHYMDDIIIEVPDMWNNTERLQYSTQSLTAASIMAGFTDIFPSSTTLRRDNQSLGPLLRYKTWSSGSAWNRQLDMNPWLAPNNVTRHMERWATAITNVIRSAPSKTMLSGQSFTEETFIVVKWAWMAFPFSLLTLSVIFLVLTIIKTSKDKSTVIWKTSAMPALIYGLPTETRHQLTSPSTWKNEPKKTRVKLMPDRGWRVSG